jgi:signal transduction histidine kinase
VVLERARIAHELHDLVAHSMAVIVLQAQAGRRVVDTNPTAADGALAAIESTGRGAMAELRRLLDVLHLDGEIDDLDPRPGLASLPVLAERVGSAGMPVTIAVEGCARPLPAGVDLSAYRIVQEALTNARRHAPGAAVDVELRYADDALRLRIRDNGPGQAARYRAGHGLLGMRERAAAVGGSLQTGDARGGGFCVEAELPAKAPDAMTGTPPERTHQ